MIYLLFNHSAGKKLFIITSSSTNTRILTLLYSYILPLSNNTFSCLFQFLLLFFDKYIFILIIILPPFLLTILVYHDYLSVTLLINESIHFCIDHYSFLAKIMHYFFSWIKFNNVKNCRYDIFTELSHGFTCPFLLSFISTVLLI